MPEFKAGDWKCPECEDHQFARNEKCRKCGAQRPAGHTVPAKLQFKQGDWVCPRCGGHQFASRSRCRDCDTPREAQDQGTNTKCDVKPTYLVMDFEANCSGEQFRDHEIIEFPAVLIDARTGAIIAEWHSFVQMATHKKLSNFIKDLTHITDQQVLAGRSWTATMTDFEKWCREMDLTPERTTVITCGDWDLKTMLPQQLERTKTKLSPFLHALFGAWTNIKVYYSKAMGVRAPGMDGMLKEFGIELTGHHHSGIDDSRNIAKICQQLVERGYDITQPTKIREKPYWHGDSESIAQLPYRRTKRGTIVPNFVCKTSGAF